MFNQSDAVDFPLDFLVRLKSDEQNRTEQNRTEQNRTPVCVWGGASKGVVFSLLRLRAGLSVDTVIDVNPAKQGKFLPATGLKVLSPERALVDLPTNAAIYVMNSNYLQEIKEMSHNKFHYIGIDL